MLQFNYRVPRIDVAKCHTCKSCLVRKSCRTRALVQIEAHELPYINQELCRGCFECVDQCPFRAIVVE